MITAERNIIMGVNTRDNLSRGNNNIIIGTQTASKLTDGSNNILIGDYNGANISNQLVIQGFLYLVKYMFLIEVLIEMLVTVSGNIVNDRVGTGVEIYTFSKTITPSTTWYVFTISNTHGGQNFICMVCMVCIVNYSTAGFSLCQFFSVVAAHGKTPSVNTLSDIGAYVNGGGSNDFTVTFSNSVAYSVRCNVNNISTGGDGDQVETGDFLVTIFLGGAITTTTVTAH